MATGTANDFGKQPDCPKIHIKAIVPVGAASHQLGDGAMTYLSLHGVHASDLILAAFELSVMSKAAMPIDSIMVHGVYDKFINLVEELEYSGKEFDPQTLEEQYQTAVYRTYRQTFPYFRKALVERGIEDLTIPYLNRVRCTTQTDSNGTEMDIFLDITIEDDNDYAHYTR